MIEIMMELTTSEMETKAMSTSEMVFTMSVTELINTPAMSEYWMVESSLPSAVRRSL